MSQIDAMAKQLDAAYAEIARLRSERAYDAQTIKSRADTIRRLRTALEAQLEAHNHAEILDIARKALENILKTAPWSSDEGHDRCIKEARKALAKEGE